MTSARGQLTTSGDDDVTLNLLFKYITFFLLNFQLFLTEQFYKNELFEK